MIGPGYKKWSVLNTADPKARDSQKKIRHPIPHIATVSWRAFLLYQFIWLALAAGAGAGGAYWLITRYNLAVPVMDQNLRIKLPDQLQVGIELVQMQPEAQVAGEDVEMVFLPLHLKDSLEVMTEVDAMVPLKLNVPYEGEVQVRATLPIDMTVETRFLGIPMNMPVKADVPIDALIPVKMSVPIDQKIRIKMKMPVKATLDHKVNIPIPAKQTAKIAMESDAMDITVQDSEIMMPLSGVTLKRPERK